MLHFVTFGDKKGGAGQVLPVRLFETPDFQKLASGQNLPLFAIPLFATLSILKPMISKNGTSGRWQNWAAPPPIK